MFRTPPQMLQSNMIVSHYAGSLAYGTNLPTSDTDIRGIFVADENYLRNPWLNSGEISIPEQDDTKYYELTKFMILVAEQNPNIIESLWIDERHVIQSSDAYVFLRSQRDHLLSSKMFFTYSGYAHSQLKRIKGHNKWLNNPYPEQAPQHIDFCSLIQDFTPNKHFKVDRKFFEQYNKDHILLPYGNNIFAIIPQEGGRLYNEQYGSLNIADITNRPIATVPNQIIKFNVEVFKENLTNHSHYWEWKHNRNKVRSVLEEQFGYDTKHASHLIRLLKMCNETLETGQLIVYRPDAEELKDIRAGKFTYEQLIQYADDLENRARELYKTTTLPRKVDLEKSAEILFQCQNIVWNK